MFRVFYLFNSFDEFNLGVLDNNYLHSFKQSIKSNNNLFRQLFSSEERRVVDVILFCSEMNLSAKKKKGCSLTFPWWCLFIVYGLSMIFGGVSIFFIIVRGIEFGDLKTQQWLTSLLTGFFSSILLIQPLKVRLVILKRTRLFDG